MDTAEIIERDRQIAQRLGCFAEALQALAAEIENFLIDLASLIPVS